MIEALVFVFGLLVGSFLNAVIYRLSVNKSAATGRSFCPDCGHTLHTVDLIPVASYLALKGRCRYCKEKISPQYPVVELVTAFLFLLIVTRMLAVNSDTTQALIISGLYAVFTAFLIIIFVYDLLHYLILDSVIIPAAVIALIGSLLLGKPVWSLLLGVVIGAGFFALQFAISKGRWIGGGDIRLGGLMGLLLGWPGILVALFLSYIFGGVFSGFLLASGRRQLGSKIPFGTFLTVGTFITLLYGDDLLQWYLQSANLPF